LCTQFTESEMVDLTVAIGAVNAWNRLSIAFRRMPLPHEA
jgi:alkylhydroperoxidase family enzyme